MSLKGHMDEESWRVVEANSAISLQLPQCTHIESWPIKAADIQRKVRRCVHGNGMGGGIKNSSHIDSAHLSGSSESSVNMDLLS